MAKIGSLSVDLNLETAAFIRDWGRSAQAVERNTSIMATRMRSLQRSAASVQRRFGDLRAAFGAYIGLRTAKSFIDTADAAAELEGKLRLVTGSTAELNDVQGQLFDVAQKTRGSLEGTVDLYSRLARSTKSLGVSNEQLLSVTESVNKAVVISGSSAASANAALFQLGQGLAAGALRGEELNSVMEQTPRVAQAIADSLGIGIGELRKYGQEGKITSRVVINAFKSQADVLDQEFAQMPRTVGQALTQLGNQWLVTVGQVNTASGAASELAGAIDQVRRAIASPQFHQGLAVTVKGVAALASNMQLVAIAAAAIVGARLGRLLGPQGAILGGIVGGTEAWLAYKAAVDAANAAQAEFEKERANPTENAAPPQPPVPEKEQIVPPLPGTSPEEQKALQASIDKMIQYKLTLDGLGASMAESVQGPMEAYRAKLEEIAQLEREGAISAQLAAKLRGQAQINLADKYTSAAAQVSGTLAQAFEENKEIQIANATINAAAAAVRALDLPFPLNWAQVAAVSALAVQQIRAIRSARPGGGGGGGGGASVPSAGSRGGASAAAASSSAPTQAIYLTINGRDGFSGEQVRQLAEQLGQYTRDGGMALKITS